MFLFASNIAEAQVTFGTGKINVRVDKYGAIRIFTTEGTDTVQHINRISVIAAGNPYQVIEYWNDLEVNIPTELVSSPTLSDYEVTGAYDNAYSGLPPNFLLEQNVYGWSDQAFCISKTIIKNQETIASPVLAGLDIIQYVDFTWEDDKIFYDAANQLLTQYDIHYVGIKILSEPTTSGQVFEWYDDYELSDSNYYNWLYGASFDTDTLVTDADGGVGILGGEPTTLQPNETKTFYFAVAVGSSGTEMLANMQAAVQKYNQLTAVETENNLPHQFVLEQNFPNPFNPETSIKFSIPEREIVSLRVYNSLGQEVAVPIENEMEAGSYNLKFDGSNLSSGIYLYTIKAGNFVQTKKMILIK
jgi:hypothetical protein